jgi:sugar phosphate isomerase/epimerase
VLKRAVDYAAKKGVILGLENHGGVTENADTIVKIIKAVDSPWVGMNLDLGNFIHSPYESMEKCMPFAVNVQAKVSLREQGKPRVPADWDRIGGMLVKQNYRGYLALEYEEKEPTSTAMPRLLKRLNEVVHKYSA